MASLQDKKIKDTYAGLIKTEDNDVLGVNQKEITDGSGNGSGIHIDVNGNLKAEGILEFGSLKDTAENITISKFVDEADGIASNDNDTSIPTTAAVKNYVDSNVTAQDLDFSGDSGTGAVDLDSQSLNLVGANGVATSAVGQTITIDTSSLDDRLTTAELDIDTNSSGISTEVSNRTSADTTLQNNINSEAATRIANDNTLQSNIDSEESARIAADASLQSQISSNDTDIATNAANIATNATNISSNDIDIASLIAKANASFQAIGIALDYSNRVAFDGGFTESTRCIMEKAEDLILE